MYISTVIRFKSIQLINERKTTNCQSCSDVAENIQKSIGAKQNK